MQSANDNHPLATASASLLANLLLLG